MKNSILILIIALVSCSKKDIKKPLTPVTHKVTYIVDGGVYWFQHYNLDSGWTTKNDTTMGIDTIEYIVDDWSYLNIIAFPDTGSEVMTAIYVDDELCSSDHVVYSDLRGARSKCEK